MEYSKGARAMSQTVTKADVIAAYDMIRAYVRKTPVIEVAANDLGLPAGLPPIALKLEHLQHAGSFKARGARYNIMANDIPDAGVVAASGGNHGAALAWAAANAGIPAKIFVFDYTPDAKVNRIANYGAEVERVANGFDALMKATYVWAETTGAMLVHAYDQPGTLMGQGTTALEFQDQAEVDTYLIATGGGGLIGGCAAYLEDSAKLVSVEPEGCPHLSRALEAERPVPVHPAGYAKDSLGPQQVGDLMFPIAQAYVDDAVLVCDEAIRGAQVTLWEKLRLVVEPGGATALAALMSGVYVPEPDERVGVLLCGANTDAVHFPD